MVVKTSWDDGTIQDIRIAELCGKYDLEAIFYFPVYPERVNEVKGRQSLTKGQRQAIALDNEIGSHTLTHPLLTRIPETAANHEIVVSKEMLEDEFGKPVKSFCYPRGYANAKIQRHVEEAGYTNARSTLVGYIHKSENPFFEQTTVHVGCDRKEYGGVPWLEYGLNLLDEAVRTPGSVYSIFGHSWELEQNSGWFDLEILLKAVHGNTHS